MPTRIHLDTPQTLEADRALVDAMWRRSLEERATANAPLPDPLPHAHDYPTARFLITRDTDTNTCIGVAGSILPAPNARYGFESRIPFDHPALPPLDRAHIGEGLMLYVLPEHRRQGLAYVLTFFSMLLPWDAGASHIVAENGAVSLDMARAAGFTDTGVVTMHRGDVPYHLTVGVAEEVLHRAWPHVASRLATLELAPPLRALVERFEQHARSSE